MSFILDIITRVMNLFGDAVFAALSFFSPAVALVTLSAVIGWLMLLIWGWTSNQTAIKEVRNQIAAHLLSTRLFKDNLAVTFRAQRMILWYAMKLMGHSLKPMIIMAVPFVLVMSQIGLRYEFRPFQPGEPIPVTVTLKPLNEQPGSGKSTSAPSIDDKNEPMKNALVAIGSQLKMPGDVTRDRFDPCRAIPERTSDWRLSASAIGEHPLEFGQDDDIVQMPLYVGESLERISSLRGGHWFDRILYSAEASIPPDSAFESIRIVYPSRDTPIFGYKIHWLVTLFVLSIVFALVIKPFTKVHI
ncbi:MAG: hypothetical protein IPK83_09635 [Planctomycetes bacterium]|nr:hypothetical protein [Planctomycetota bacterium]